MSAAVVPIGARVARFTAAQLREARAMAEAAGQRAISTLEEASGLAPAEFITRLGATLGYATLSAADLGNAQPDFDVLPYPEAARRECAALRVGDGPVLLAFADPFQADLQAWADHRIDAVFEWRLVHHEELAVFLRRHEESLRALDEVRPEDELSVATEGAEDLSLVAISEDDSPVVKIVNSTLYDALKVGASDIHLESRARGLAIKYRIDGVLNHVRTVNGREQSRPGDLAHQGDGRTGHLRDAACRRTGASRCARAAARSTCGCRSCRASSARTRCCGSSTSRRCPTTCRA